jgi:phytoene synthase
MAEPPLSYCAAELRRHDPDRFLTALFAPAGRREELFALYAFNLEVAKTREAVSEPMIGRIRLQWWRETIAGIYAGAPRRHAVVQPLAAAIARAKLSRAHFERLIDGRESDLEEEPPADLAALVDYAEATSASLAALALEVLGAAGEAAERAARDVGIAWALVGTVRAVPFHARFRRLRLPRALLDAAAVTPVSLFDHGDRTGLPKAVAPILAHAAERLAAARRRRGEVPRAALPALLPATLASRYLRELRRAGNDPFALPPPRRRASRPLRLALAAATGRY